MPSHSAAVTGGPDRAYWPLKGVGTAAPGCIRSGAHITPTMLEGAEELLSAAEDFKRTLE